MYRNSCHSSRPAVPRNIQRQMYPPGTDRRNTDMNTEPEGFVYEATIQRRLFKLRRYITLSEAGNMVINEDLKELKDKKTRIN